MQTDPIGYGDGLNWYNYVGSDPINKVDPTGLCGSGGGSCHGQQTGISRGGSNGGEIVVSGVRQPTGPTFPTYGSFGFNAGSTGGDGYWGVPGGTSSGGTRTRKISKCFQEFLTRNFAGFDWSRPNITSATPWGGRRASTGRNLITGSLFIHTGNQRFSNIESDTVLFFHEVGHIPDWADGTLKYSGYALSAGGAIITGGSDRDSKFERLADEVGDALEAAYNIENRPCDVQ